MQKAKHRASTVTKIIYVPTYPQNGNGYHKEDKWVVGDPPEKHPLAGIAGSYKDDPFWDEFIQTMQEERQKELARDLKNLESKV